MANDDTLLSKPSVLEKLEERRKADQILEVIFGMMPSKHVCDIFHELGFECEALGGAMLLMMQLHGDQENQKKVSKVE